MNNKKEPPRHKPEGKRFDSMKYRWIYYWCGWTIGLLSAWAGFFIANHIL